MQQRAFFSKVIPDLWPPCDCLPVTPSTPPISSPHHILPLTSNEEDIPREIHHSTLGNRYSLVAKEEMTGKKDSDPPSRIMYARLLDMFSVCCD